MREKLMNLDKKTYIIAGAIVLVLVLVLVINYLSLSNIDLTLRSQNVVLNIGDDWEDPGVVCYKNGENLTSSVKTDSNVNLSKTGIYTVKYKIRSGLLSKSVKREVVVLDTNASSDISFKLNGGSYAYLLKGNKYNEAGYTAFDKIDGDISNRVQIIGNINSNLDGMYELKYIVKNSRGVVKKLIRRVEVYTFEFNASLKYSNYVKENEIIINITDKNYRYTILPNGETTYEKIIHYLVHENDLYSFKFYDENNNAFNYHLEVNNIDLESPTGSCTYTLYDKSGDITVEATDDGNIKGYIYKYGSNESKMVSDTTYHVDTLDSQASVLVYDDASNYANLKCEVVDKSTKIGRSYVLKEIVNSKGKKHYYWFYTPANSVRQNLPLLIYLHGDGGRKNTAAVNNYAYPNFVSTGMDFPFYMIAPYVNNESDFRLDSEQETILEIIRSLSSTHNIDSNRIMISGGSSGARGAYMMAAKYKTLFSCLVIGSGITNGMDPENLTHLPIWIFHGKSDTVISYGDVEKRVERINAAGGNAKFTLVDGGHGITETVFKYPELIEWMVNQRLDNNKKNN